MLADIQLGSLAEWTHHSFIPQRFTEHLLYTRHNSRPWEYSDPNTLKKEGANELQTFQLNSHDLSIPTVRRMHQATVASVSARVLSRKNNLVCKFSN